MERRITKEDRIMKKTISNIRTLAALLMAGAAFTACSSSDEIINEQPANTTVKQGYTLTVSASKDGSATRALDVDGSAIVASWETTDEIVVTKNGTEVGTLSPTNISGLTATFTGTISGDADINVNDVLTLTYHPIASLSDFASQDGTLNGLATSAENFDMAMATVTISEISGKNIIVSESSANFVNQTAVVVLSPYNTSWSEYHSLNSLTVSATITIPGVGAVTEKFGPFTLSGDYPYYFALPSQAYIANLMAAKYSISATICSGLLSSATVTFTGHQTDDDYDRVYLTCSKTGYKFAAGKYYKLDNSNFSMTYLNKHAAAGKDVYVESADNSWSHTVTFAVNSEIGWKVVGDNVFCGDKQLYVEVGPGPLGPDPWEGFVKASDDFIPHDATYSLRDPAPPTLADVFTDGAVVEVKFNTALYGEWYGVTGTYNAGTSTYSTTKSGSSDAPGSVSMTKDGNNLVASATDYNTITITFNTTTNEYTVDATSNTSSDWRMISLKSITVNGTDITSTLTDATPAASTVTWDFSQLSGYTDLWAGYENGGVTLQGEGNLNFNDRNLDAQGTCAFIAPSGKKFTSIVITVDPDTGGYADIDGFDVDWSGTTATWSGSSTDVSLSEGNYASGITSIVFTLVDE